MYLKNDIEELVSNNFNMIKRNHILCLDNAILNHYKLVSSLYKKNPPLYKTIFKSYRFNLISLIATEYYTKKNPTFSDLYDFFLPLNLMSKNSTSSFLSFLIVTGRLERSIFTKDRRKVTYKLTEKFKSEAFMLIETMVYPLCKLVNIEHATRIDVDSFLHFFLNNFSRIIYNNLFSFNNIHNSDIFLTKDAGHNILVSLYCNRKQHTVNTYSSLSVRELSNTCGVSRSHIKKILSNAGAVNLINNSGSEGKVILTQEFIELVQNYMAKYFSFCLVGLEFK